MRIQDLELPESAKQLTLIAEVQNARHFNFRRTPLAVISTPEAAAAPTTE